MEETIKIGFVGCSGFFSKAIATPPLVGWLLTESIEGQEDFAS